MNERSSPLPCVKRRNGRCKFPAGSDEGRSGAANVNGYPPNSVRRVGLVIVPKVRAVYGREIRWYRVLSP